MESNSIADTFNVAVWAVIFITVTFQFFRSLYFVPTKMAYIVERFGRYQRTLEPGFHAIVPFVDKVSDRVNLKEMTVDVPPQYCFSKDEINLQVDGVIYLSTGSLPVSAVSAAPHACANVSATVGSVVGRGHATLGCWLYRWNYPSVRFEQHFSS